MSIDYSIVLTLLCYLSCTSPVNHADQKTSEANIQSDRREVMVDSQTMVAARQKFEAYCTQCHGEEGEGRIGPNLTDAYWIHGNTEMQICDIIREGVPAKGMLAWKNILSEEEIKAISILIRELEESQSPEAKTAEGYLYSKEGKILSDSSLTRNMLADNLSGIPLGGDIARGQKLFNGSFGCARCHGRDIRGLTDNRDLKRMTQRYGPEAGLVFDVVTKDGRPGTAMPPWLHLKMEDLKDLKSFIFSIQESENNRVNK